MKLNATLKIIDVEKYGYFPKSVYVIIRKITSQVLGLWGSHCEHV